MKPAQGYPLNQEYQNYSYNRNRSFPNNQQNYFQSNTVYNPQTAYLQNRNNVQMQMSYQTPSFYNTVQAPYQPTFSPQFDPLYCPACRSRTENRIDYHSGQKVFIWAFIMMLTTGFCCIPFCIDDCKNQHYVCVNCNTQKYIIKKKFIQ